jgi:hypothetical protein
MHTIPKTGFAALWFVGTAVLPAGAGELLTPLFRRGDANLDGAIRFSDASFLEDALLLDGEAPGCVDAADVNDDGRLHGADPLYLLDWLFGSGAAPPSPFTTPGADLTLDGLGCLLSAIELPDLPVPGVRLDLEGPRSLARGQRGVPLFLTATTLGPIDAFSIALEIDRQAIAVRGADFEETVFPAALRAAFESSALFRFAVIPQPQSARDLLLVGAIFIGPDGQRIRFPATTGRLSGAPLLRLLIDVVPDAPLGQRTVLENASPPLGLAGLLTELTGGGSSIFPEGLPSYRIPVVEAGELILNRRSDANNDRFTDISDPMYTLSALFLGGRPPDCQDTADSNDDGTVDIADPIYTLQFLFTAGPPPPPPYPDCGVDPTLDTLPFCTTTCRR